MDLVLALIHQNLIKQRAKWSDFFIFFNMSHWKPFYSKEPGTFQNIYMFNLLNLSKQAHLSEGVKKQQFFKGTCPLSSDTPPPQYSLRGQKRKKKIFFSFFINISIEPVLRLGVTRQKKCFQGMLNIYYILSEIFLVGGGSNPHLIGDMSHKKQIFF